MTNQDSKAVLIDSDSVCFDSIFGFHCTEKRVCADILEDEPQLEAKRGGNDSMGFTWMTIRGCITKDDKGNIKNTASYQTSIWVEFEFPNSGYIRNSDGECSFKKTFGIYLCFVKKKM